MAIFKARSNDDLTILRAGMCPDCGAGVYRGMAACKACDLQFDNNLLDLPPPKAPAPPAAPPTPPSSPPPSSPHPQYAQQAPPHAQQAQQPRPAAPPQAAPSDPSGFGLPLTLDDIEILERGPLKFNEHPLTDAEAPEVVSGAVDPLLGSSLARAAIVVMADAAVCDDPLVLLGFPPVVSHVARAFINLRRSDAADIDDAELLAAGPPTPRAVATAPATTQAPSARAPAPVRAEVAPGRGLTVEEIEALEHPVPFELPHSFAELHDLEGLVDPLLGAALIRGANAAMADAAVIDDPLVLLGYPAVIPRDIARAMINLRRGDAALVDDVESLLKRTPIAPPSVVAASSASGPVRRADPDATALLDQNAIRAAAAAIAREQQQQQQQNRVPSVISGRGGVLSLDDT